MKQKWSAMFERGYNDAVIRFSYIPDFNSEKEQKEYFDGYKYGKLIKEGENGNIQKR